MEQAKARMVSSGTNLKDKHIYEPKRVVFALFPPNIVLNHI